MSDKMFLESLFEDIEVELNNLEPMTSHEVAQAEGVVMMGNYVQDRISEFLGYY